METKISRAYFLGVFLAATLALSASSVDARPTIHEAVKSRIPCNPDSSINPTRSIGGISLGNTVQVESKQIRCLINSPRDIVYNTFDRDEWDYFDYYPWPAFQYLTDHPVVSISSSQSINEVPGSNTGGSASAVFLGFAGEERAIDVIRSINYDKNNPTMNQAREELEARYGKPSETCRSEDGNRMILRWNFSNSGDQVFSECSSWSNRVDMSWEGSKNNNFMITASIDSERNNNNYLQELSVEIFDANLARKILKDMAEQGDRVQHSSRSRVVL